MKSAYRGYLICSNHFTGHHWVERDGVHLAQCEDNADGRRIIDELKGPRPKQVEKHDDGTVTIRGSGWYWARFNARGRLVDFSAGGPDRPSWQLFLRKARQRAALEVTV